MNEEIEKISNGLFEVNQNEIKLGEKIFFRKCGEITICGWEYPLWNFITERKRKETGTVYSIYL